MVVDEEEAEGTGMLAKRDSSSLRRGTAAAASSTAVAAAVGDGSGAVVALRNQPGQSFVGT